MSKSYKSALPTWTTYTPYVSPLSTQAPINQEVLWRNRARQYSPPSVRGDYNRIAAGIDASVRGTGAAQAVGGILGHRPFLAEAGKHTAPIRNLWARRMQEAVQQGTPEAMTAAPGEQAPLAEMQVRAARTAPSSVNPADMQQQAAARGTIETVVPSVIGSSTMGTGSMNVGPESEPKKLWTPPRLQPNRSR